MRAASAFVLALPILASASIVSRQANQCNTGSLQCCTSVQSPTSSSVSTLLGLLGVVVGSVTGLVGFNCSPITVIGASQTSCTQQPVCCTNNSFNGLVALGCTPVSL